MESELPKVLVPVCGRPMVRYVIDALRAAGVGRIVVVVGYRAELVREALRDEPGVEFAEQTEQLGTGHAVMMCREQLAEHRGPVMIVAGDSPLLQASSVASLLSAFDEQACCCLVGTVEKDDPTGMGRILRDDSGAFVGIVEEKDATAEQRAIREINVSLYVFDSQRLLSALEGITSENAQQEYYITDCPKIMLAKGEQVQALAALQPCEALSINDQADLAVVEKEMQRQQPKETR